jgi:hypothetical protein
LPQSKHGHVLNALTCRFAPLAGLEPATYGLEVNPRPSAGYHLMPFFLLKSGASSS